MPESLLSVPNQLDRAWPGQSWGDVNVAVALSGGADSVGLLRATWEIKQRTGGAGKLCALHVNHQLRGAESDEDALWCEQFCKSLGVPLTVLVGNAAQRANDEGDGIEAAARAERYELLSQSAESWGARYLATAHTRDDQAETVLMRMLRGAGLRGMSGIPAMRILSPSLTLVRPLLEVTREQLFSYLAKLGQQYRSDSSNTTSQFMRNRVRNQLLPLLRAEYSPDVDDVLARLAGQAGDAQRLLEDMAAELLSRCEPQRSSTLCSLRVGPLSGEPRIVVCEVLRTAWRNARLPEQAMTCHWWQRLARLATEEEREVLNLPGNVRASTAGGRLTLQW